MLEEGNMKTQILVTFFICCLLVATKSFGQETPSSGKGDFFGVSLGAKGAIGGNYLNKPNETLTDGSLPYEDGAGGWGGGGGLYTEFRILWGYLGLEFDLLFDHSKNWCDIDFNTLETSWIYSFTSLRMPILLKGNLLTDTTRVSFGIGPEFAVGLSTDTDIEFGQTFGAADQWRQNFTARKQNDTFLCFDLGLALKVWELAITIDLRYSYNLSQPDKYEDRTEVVGNDETFTVDTIASNTMDGRILLGIAYELSFDY
jgi:hypothetical protein